MSSPSMTPADELSTVKYRGASRLRMERVRRGLSMRDVLSATTISSTSCLAGWEMEEHLPSWEWAIELSEFYGVPVDELFPAWRNRSGMFREAA